MKFRAGTPVLIAAALTSARLAAGPYSMALNDPSNPHDAPIPGFVGPHGIGKARYSYPDIDGNQVDVNPGNIVNPLFFGWVVQVVDYSPSGTVSSNFSDPQYAEDVVTGDHLLGVVSLGEMSREQIDNDGPPGSITVVLDQPVRNLSGADFVVFENGTIAAYDFGGSGAGHLFAELAYVEVSADGVNFVTFPSASLNPPLKPLPEPLGTKYASLDVSNVHNLAGKHANAYGDSWGTPFDLTDVGLQEITHIRLVDIPGTGDFTDAAGRPIYDPWQTEGSGGFDIEAVGAISTPMSYGAWPQLEHLAPEDRGPMEDPDGDGACNLLEYAAATLPSVADAVSPVVLLAAGQPAITFTRDERLTDLVLDVQSSPDLTPGSWSTLATSTGGAPFQAAPGKSPVISESSASNILSIGVIRRVTVRDTAPLTGRGFLRVKASLQPASLPRT